MEETETVYVDWAIEDLNRLRGSYLDLIDEKGQKTATVRELEKVAHDIEGQGGNYDFPLMTSIGSLLGKFAHEKDTLNQLDIEVVRLHVEALQTVIKGKIVGDGGEQGRKLVEGLEKVIKKIS
ncbi:MAG: hypothetical protein OQK35_06440 [Alphaproteobacteria bacterium]|nr:hypothetical protein [Rhodospirillales bacterium]MCW9045956.1 hypothetical protein [Alphaproteobacteria bacterium]